MNSERILESKLALKEVPSVCLSIYLLGRLLQHKDNELIIDCSTDCLWTGKEIHDCCLSIADAFINLFDLNPGDTVCFWCPNSDLHAITFLATISSGANYVAIDPNYSYDDVFRVIKLSSAKFLICIPEYMTQAIAILKNLESLQRLFIIGGNKDVIQEKNCHFLLKYMRYQSIPDSVVKPIPIPVPVKGDDMCVIHFIKQTKDGIHNQLVPVIRTNTNLIHSATQLHHSDIFQVNSDQTIIGQHFSNYLGLIMFCHSIISGNRIALHRNQFNRQETMQYLTKYNISCASIDLNELFYLLRNDVEIRSLDQKFSKLYHDFTNLKELLYTGPPLPHSDSLIEEVFRKINPKYFRTIYGKPETGVISCILRSLSTFDTNKCIAKYYSFGFPVPGVQIKIIHPKTEKPRLQNKIGEICVKSKQMIENSKNLSILTRNAFTIDGFFRTGDAGYYDSEGLLYVECRVDECIYERNDVINPLTLETIILKHTAVKEVAVIGVPDPVYGQISCAFVVLHQKQSVSEQTLLEFISNRGKQLGGGIKFIDTIPRTLRSKPNRMALKVIYDNFHSYSLIEML